MNQNDNPMSCFLLIKHYLGFWISHRQISHACQFADGSHFSRLHRKYYGQTPGQARNQSAEQSLAAMQTLQSNPLVSQVLTGGFTIIS